MAHDDENLYILVERLDENLYGDDSQSFMFTGASNTDATTWQRVKLG